MNVDVGVKYQMMMDMVANMIMAMRIATLMMKTVMLVKLRNWFDCVGSAQVMRSSSAFKVTEDIDPSLVIPITLLMVIIINITIITTIPSWSLGPT